LGSIEVSDKDARDMGFDEKKPSPSGERAPSPSSNGKPDTSNVHFPDRRKRHDQSKAADRGPVVGGLPVRLVPRAATYISPACARDE